MMIKWSFQKLNNAKTKETLDFLKNKLHVSSWFLLCVSFHFMAIKKAKNLGDYLDLHKIVGATTLRAVGYAMNDGKGETNCLPGREPQNVSSPWLRANYRYFCSFFARYLVSAFRIHVVWPVYHGMHSTIGKMYHCSPNWRVSKKTNFLCSLYM